MRYLPVCVWPPLKGRLSSVVSVPPSGETEGTIAGKLLFASFPSPVILIFPCGKTEKNDIRNGAEKLFFLQKVFLFATSHWELANSLFKNVPYGKESFALCGGRPGLLALDLARLSLDAIRVYSECKQQPASTRRQLYLSAAQFSSQLSPRENRPFIAASFPADWHRTLCG